MKQIPSIIIKVKPKSNITKDEDLFYTHGDRKWEKLYPYTINEYTDVNYVYTISPIKNTHLLRLTRLDSYYIDRSIQAIAEVYCTLDNKELSEIYPELFV